MTVSGSETFSRRLKLDADTYSKSQSYLALGGIASNMSFGGRGSRIWSAMVPLHRALPSFYRPFTATIQLPIRVGRNLQCKF